MAQLVDLMILLFLHFSFVVNDVVVGVAGVAAAAGDDGGGGEEEGAADVTWK